MLNESAPDPSDRIRACAFAFGQLLGSLSDPSVRAHLASRECGVKELEGLYAELKRLGAALYGPVKPKPPVDG